MAKPRPEVVALATRMFAEGLTVSDVFAEAGINRINWTRWRQGTSPRVDKLDDVDRAITTLIQRREGKPDGETK